eukprot:7296585-Ditylum_brightwellii.AAC.1
MASENKKELILDKATSSGRMGYVEKGQRKGQAPRTLIFKGSCKELKGWVFNSTESQGTDKFDMEITISKPTEPEATSPQFSKDIYKEEVREYVREKKALKRVTKQAYELVWGQCLQPMREKLRTVTDFDTITHKENTVNLLKAIKSTIFKFDNKCDVYVAMGNVINWFWHFYQARDMSNISYFEKFKNLIELAEEHGANIGLYPE